jgi:hypothetical protein
MTSSRTETWEGRRRSQNRATWANQQRFNPAILAKAFSSQEFNVQLTLKCHDSVGRIWKNRHALLVKMNKVSENRNELAVAEEVRK